MSVPTNSMFKIRISSHVASSYREGTCAVRHFAEQKRTLSLTHLPSFTLVSDKGNECLSLVSFCLSKAFRRHTVIFNQKKTCFCFEWSVSFHYKRCEHRHIRGRDVVGTLPTLQGSHNVMDVLVVLAMETT